MFVCGDDYRDWKWSEAFQARGLDEIERQVIWNYAAHGDADENILDEEREYDEGRNESARGGDGERAENILEGHDAAGPHMTQCLPGRTRFGGADTNTGGEICGRLNGLDARKSHYETAVTFEQVSAVVARFNVQAHAGVFAGRYRSIQISWQKALGTFAVHFSHPLIGCEPNDAREGSFSG
jgi:hypothetical protein